MQKNQESSFFEVKLSDYSCPLDVLLELIKKKKVEISEIKLSDLISQYVDFLNITINDLPIEEFAEYLYINSYLIMLKSKALLMGDGLETKLGSLEDGQDLIARLVEHAKYNNSVGFFQDLFEKRQTMMDKNPEDYNDYTLEEIPVGKMPKQISISKLQVYFQNIIDEIIENSYEDDDRLFRTEVEFNQFSIKEIQKQIINYLNQRNDKKDTLLNCFKKNLENNFSRGFYSAFFLAVLTLIRYSMVTVYEFDDEGFMLSLTDNLDMRLIDVINEE